MWGGGMDDLWTLIVVIRTYHLPAARAELPDRDGRFVVDLVLAVIRVHARIEGLACGQEDVQ